jgi:hypothetical protein
MSEDDLDVRSYDVFNPLFDGDLSHLMDFECFVPEMGIMASAVDWWRHIFARASKLRRLGLQSGASIIDALAALMPSLDEYLDACYVFTSTRLSVAVNSDSDSDYIFTPGPIIPRDGSSEPQCPNHTYPSIALPHLSTIAISEDDFSGLWRPDDLDSDYQSSILNDNRPIRHLQRFIDMRNRLEAYAHKPIVSLRIADTEPSLEMQRMFQTHFEISSAEVLAPGFLLDPRYEWNCNLDLSHCQDTFTD